MRDYPSRRFRFRANQPAAVAAEPAVVVAAAAELAAVAEPAAVVAATEKTKRNS